MNDVSSTATASTVASQADPPAPPRAATTAATGAPAPTAPTDQTGSVARSAAAMSAATFLSRIAGLVREQTFAYLFGAGVWTDAFNVAFRIPNLLRDLFAEGAMSAAFVPTFNAVLAREGREPAFRLANVTLSVLTIVLGGLSGLGILLSPWLVGLLAPEFAATPGKTEVTILMTRIMFPFLLAISLAAITMGVLNSLGAFFAPAIAPVFLNLAMIVAGFTLCPWFAAAGHPAIVGMAVGAMLGGILQFAVQVVPLWRRGFRPAWLPDFNDPGMRQIVRLIIPGTLGLAATQINVAISTILATSQGNGPVSWLGYAFRLMQLPLGLFGVAIAQATLPAFSRAAARHDRDEMATTLAGSLNLTAFINVAASLFLIALAHPLIRLLFQHGRFTPADTAATAVALQAYAVGLLGFSAVKVLGPAFYALGETRVPVTASLVAVGLNIALNLALLRPCGYWGLALGSSLASGLNALILYQVLSRRLPGLATQGIGRRLAAILVAAAAGAATAAGVAARLTDWLLTRSSPGTSLAIGPTLGVLVSATAIGLVALAAVGHLLGLPEVARAWHLFARRFRRTGPARAS
ncbi:MAG: putative peptidoglycan lipid II flippase MurJ [Candidatus Ozemobacter sibiricus]|uniref:Probable lipid II flippase MurJ n=1 Tax=Candidatus Ozemobacter sibiricus TaxID=2268124 RepID=A0A367ZKW8_9BACT|nr:MAG: putative peptidoglycan lipid II flippase MurJ [Candidatus Ozemobacter sibiricus]